MEGFDAEVDMERKNTSNLCAREKVIFCLDELFFTKKYKTRLLPQLCQALQSYIEAKKKVASKIPEFHLLLLIGETRVLLHLEDENAIQDILGDCENLQTEEQAFNLGVLFSFLAEKLELPDPTFYENRTNAPYVYHVILLFGHNFAIPYMNDVQPFYFLYDNPYFTFDILYLKNSKLQNSKTREVSKALSCLINSDKEFFSEVELSNNNNIQNDLRFAIHRLLGHTSVRSPMALFNVFELSKSTSA